MDAALATTSMSIRSSRHAVLKCRPYALNQVAHAKVKVRHTTLQARVRNAFCVCDDETVRTTRFRFRDSSTYAQHFARDRLSQPNTSARLPVVRNSIISRARQLIEICIGLHCYDTRRVYITANVSRVALTATRRFTARCRNHNGS